MSTSTHMGTTSQSPEHGETDSALLNLIIQTAPDAVITANADGIILSFSPSAERMFGYAPEEVIGKNVSVLMPEPYRGEHDGYMEHYHRTGQKRVIGIGREVRAQRADGTVFAAEIAVGEFFAGDAPLYAGFIRDISERVEAQRRAARLQRSLDRVARIQMLGELSTALAHELSQPLAAITNFANAAQRLLSAASPDVAKASGHMAEVAAQARRAGEIIKRMRRMIDRGQADLRPEDVNDIVIEAVRLVRQDLPSDGFDIICELGEGLPPVLADRIQIQQVIFNLLRNSIEAIEGEGSHDIHISTELRQAGGAVIVRARHVDDEVVVSVHDSGPGLPRDLLHSVFDPFTSGKEHGLGVGLAISRSIIESHGGRIWVDKSDGSGACFHFSLKVTEPE